MVDARYRNKKNGRVAVVVQEDPKYKTSLIQYEDDGSEQQVSNITLKRWWEELDDEDEEVDDIEDDEDLDDEYEDEEEYEDDDEDEDVEDDESDEDEEDEDPEEDAEDDTEEDPEEVEDDDLAGDGTPLKEVGKEIAAQAKKKAEAAKKASTDKPKKQAKKKAEANPAIIEMMEYVESVVKEQGGEIYKPESQAGTRAFKVGGHMYARMLSTRSAVTLTCRAVVADDIAEPTKRINHMFANLYSYESMSAEDKKLVKKLLQASFKYQEEKNSSSGKKTKAEDKKVSKKGGKK